MALVPPIRPKLAVALIASIALGFTSSARAADLLLPVFETPPWAYFDAACAPQGIAVDVVRTIVDDAGLRLAFRYEGAVYLPGVTPAGPSAPIAADPVIALSAHPPQDGMVLVAPLVFEIEVAALPAEGQALHSASELAGRRVGYDRDERLVKTIIEGLAAEAVGFADYPSLIDGLRRGVVESVVGVREGLVYGFRAGDGPRSPMPAPIVLTRQPVSLLIERRAGEEVRLRIEGAVERFLSRKQYASLRDRHLAFAATRRIAPRPDCVARN